MKEQNLVHRIPNLIIVCLILVGLFAFSLYFQNNTASAAHRMSPHTVSIHPDYRYAGQPHGKTFACQSNTSVPRCYGPTQIRQAYSIQPLLNAGITGKGRTIVIVDAYQAPDIQSDLSFFDQTFGLNDPKLNIIAPDGLTPFDPTNADEVDWSGEISLDVEWSHVVAPDATIDLVLAKSDNDSDLISAIQYAVDNNLGDTISMSFGENDACSDNAAWHKVFAEATSKNITLFASAGDSGAAQLTCDGNSYVLATSSPASDPLVTSVGGTSLLADATTGQYQSESAWNDPYGATGGGYSSVVKKPFYQYGVVPGKGRGVPDVSYNAGVNTGVLTVWSESGTTDAVYIFGGTSAGSPQWAGIIALTDQIAHGRVGFINPLLYTFFGRISPLYRQTFHNVTTGNNTVTETNADGTTVTIQGYSAAKGWDPTTGWGTPIVSTFAPALALTHSVHIHSFDQQISKLK